MGVWQLKVKQFLWPGAFGLLSQAGSLRERVAVTDSFLLREADLRLTVFLGMLAAMALAEVLAPARRAEVPRLFRWSNNFALVVIDALAVRLLFPLTAAGFAEKVAAQGWGLFQQAHLSGFAAFWLGLLALDLIIYLQHRAFHALPVLWRFHRVHHSDTVFDVSTGIRFHPVEILLSMAIKFAAIAVLGPSAVTVLLFEVLLNMTALFNHSNLHLPPRLDAMLRLVTVTPDMHRVHHSVLRRETDSNFGFNLPWWDWMFRTYRAQPEGGHLAMKIGLEEFRAPQETRLDRLLLQPLRAKGDRPGESGAGDQTARP